MRKVCIFTATRAEWGLLSGVAEQIRRSDALQLRLLVSGSHLSERFGRTVQEIEADGYPVDERVDILRFDDTPPGICKAMGLALGGYGAALERLAPGILVLLGDRYETFCAAAAAQIHRIPVAHIHGGETTEGAVDEAFRHSITKMAHLHFPSCEEYRRRVIQLGECPERVFNVGALGIENIRKAALMDRAELEASIQFKLDRPFFLVTFHPVTLEKATAGMQFDALLAAMECFPGHKIVFTKANADTDGAAINARIDSHVADHPDRCLAVTSLGFRRYLSTMKLCEAVVGNSSSGMFEAPVLGVPTVNIGDRQKGRIRVASILDCEPTCTAIEGAVRKALTASFRATLAGVVHPCERAGTAASIVQELTTVDVLNLVKKSFVDVR